MKMLEGKGFKREFILERMRTFVGLKIPALEVDSGVSLMTTTNLTLEEMTKVEGHAVLTLKITDGKVEDCHLRGNRGQPLLRGAARPPPLDEASWLSAASAASVAVRHILTAIQAMENALGVQSTSRR